jgi:hypothetical protein
MGDDELKIWTKWAEEWVQQQQRHNHYGLVNFQHLPPFPVDAAQKKAAVLGIAQMLKLNKTLKEIRYAPRAVQTSVVLASDTLISLPVTQSYQRPHRSYTER